MSRSIFFAKRIEALRLISVSAVAVVIVSLLLLVTQNRYIACSVLLGGLVWLLPNLYFAAKVFAKVGPKTTSQGLLRNFYQAEIIKLALYAILFIVVVKFLSMAVLPLLIGYAVAQIAFWSAPFLLNFIKRLRSK